MDDEDFVDLFVEEVGEHLKTLNENLLALEEDHWQPELVNSLMRAAHTIKGAAMLMGYDPMAKLSHALEDRLRAEEKLNRPVPSALIDLLLAGVDQVKKMVDLAVEVRDLESIEEREEWNALTEQILEAEISPDSLPGAEEEAPAPPSAEPEEAATTPGEATPEPSGDPAPPLSEEEMEAQLLAALGASPPETPEPPAEEEGSEASGAGAEPAPATPSPASAPEPAPRETSSPRSQASGNRGGGPKELIKIPVEKVDQLNDLVGELLIYQARLEQKEETLRGLTRRLEGLVATSERARLVGLAPLPPEVQEIQEDLTEYVEELSGDLVELNYLSADIRRRSLQIRMLPADTMIQEFRLAMRDLRRRLRKEADLVVIGGEFELDKRLLEELRPALIHLIRNSMDHGIEEPEVRLAAGKSRKGTITLTIQVEGARVHISIEDDGAGMDADKIRDRAVRFGLITPESAGTISDEEALYLVMQPGFSTNETVTTVSGRGVGMDVVRTQVEDLKGSIRIDTNPGQGTRFVLDLPLTLSTAQVLMVEVARQTLAIPIGYVEETLLLDPRDIFQEGGHRVFRLRDRTLSLYDLADFLSGLQARMSSGSRYLSVVILRGRGQRVGFLVNRFQEQAEIVVKTLGTFIQSVANISGATILGDGKPALILDVPDLLSSLTLQRGSRSNRSQGKLLADLGPGSRPGRILVVDDSITTRALQKGILENEGYEVYTAASAREALEHLDHDHFDLLLTDVEMPEMNGFQLTARVRSNPEFQDLPIVICSVMGSDEDRLKGMRLGAQAYLIKREFDQQEFCSVIRQLLR